jgi:sugar fermentation stimulation protein A
MLSEDDKQTYVEVKNCTLARDRIALFPDAITSRGTKHLEELLRLHASGHRAAIIFCIQMSGVTGFAPAADIDHLYAETMEMVVRNGVMALACQAKVSPEEIIVTSRLTVQV